MRNFFFVGSTLLFPLFYTSGSGSISLDIKCNLYIYIEYFHILERDNIIFPALRTRKLKQIGQSVTKGGKYIYTLLYIHIYNIHTFLWQSMKSRGPPERGPGTPPVPKTFKYFHENSMSHTSLTRCYK